MNIDKILSELDAAGVDFLLIGGVNFLLRHLPELTYDVDIWVEDSDENLVKTLKALHVLGAEWGVTEATWGPVPHDPGWLRRQVVFCLSTRHGALDLFREVRGLEGRYADCRRTAIRAKTPTGIPYLGLSDEHMLQTQLALDPQDQKPNRIATLKKALGRAT